MDNVERPAPDDTTHTTAPPGTTVPKQNRFRGITIALAVVGSVAIVGNSVLFGFMWHNHIVRQHQATNAYRQSITRQNLIKLLSAKTLKQHGLFTDNKFRDIEYSMQTDFSVDRYPVSKGNIKVSYDSSRTRISQTLDFVAYYGTDGQQELYFRMAAGNQFTGASSDWYRGLGRDIRALKPFENFWWLQFGDLNSNKGVVVAGNEPYPQQKQKLQSIILTDSAYHLGQCQATKSSTWCGGTLDKNGLHNIALLTDAFRYVFHDETNATKFTMWSDNATAQISRVILTSGQNDDYHDYWDINKPVDVSYPKSFQDAPILGGYRATIDSVCSDACQKQLATQNASRVAGKYY